MGECGKYQFLSVALKIVNLVIDKAAAATRKAESRELVGLSPGGCETRDFVPNSRSVSSFVFTQTPQNHENSDSNH